MDVVYCLMVYYLLFIKDAKSYVLYEYLFSNTTLLHRDYARAHLSMC
jgi:hypothetical protein